MGKILWWTGLIIIWEIFFPVVLIIVIGILLAFMMGVELTNKLISVFSQVDFVDMNWEIPSQRLAS